jgi:1-acyl-sn-glycerol-3-phosphate acyltransferase
MRWRRSITVPAYLGLWIVALATSPLWLLLAAAVDLLRRTPAVALRSGVYLTFYLSCEVLGLAISAVIWLWALVARPDRERWEDIHFRLEAWWGDILFRAGTALFGLTLEVTGAEEARLDRGPYLLLLRHVSVGDTVLPSTLVARPLRMRLRYVLKRELLWDPCLDVVGQRIPNVFVDRFSDDPAAEVRRVQVLSRDLGPRDGVYLCPEGTRFTEAKRARVMERLEQEGKHELLEAARSFEAVLPPRLGGTLGLLEAAPEADVVVGAHTGFEGTMSLARLWNGALVGRTIRVEFWRVPRAEIPEGRGARTAWLLEQWRLVNDWVLRNRKE